MIPALVAKAKAIKAGVHHELLSNVMRMRQACNHPSLASTVLREDAVEDVSGGAAAGGGGTEGGSGAAAAPFQLDPDDDDDGWADEAPSAAAAAEGKFDGAKLSALLKVLDEAKKQGEKVLVFSFFKRFLDLVATSLGQNKIANKRIVRRKLATNLPLLAS